MKINIQILKKSLLSHELKLDNLNEKELIKKMILRRRFSRSSKILVKLANDCNFTNGDMIYGSSYGEVIDTANILNSINNNEAVSPSSFQNSVYNTAASYHSILHNNKSEIFTLSCGDKTSYRVMQQGALSSLREEEVFVSTIEAMNFEGVEILNKCKNNLECGVAFVIKKTDKKANITVINKQNLGVPASISWMKNLYTLCESIDNPIVEIEL